MIIAFLRGVAVAVTLATATTGACAQTIQIAAVRARLFFQHSGEFSPWLTGGEVLWNVIVGGGEFDEPASSALIDISIVGKPKSFVSKQFVELRVLNQRTGKVVTRQRGRTGTFGPDGQTHVGFWLSSIGCEPLVLVASVAGSTNSLTLPFRCGE